MKFDCKKAIKSIIDFPGNNEIQGATLNIAWGVDENFMFGAVVSMTSVLINNKNINTHLHLFTDYIDDDFENKIKKLAQDFSTDISIYIVDAEELKVLPNGNAWTYAMYFRFVAFEYLSDNIKTLLYIDADVICKGSLLDLCYLDIEEYIAAVVKDVDDSPARKIEENYNYFNSGVVYANLKKWKDDVFLDSVFDLLLDKNVKLSFPDQDALNIVFADKVIFLPRIYNAIYGIKQELKNKNIEKYKEYITPDTILIHYVGVTKPWNTWANYPSVQYFIDAWKSSPWSEKPRLQAKTPKQYKKKSRHERLQGKYFISLVSYLGYLVSKLKR